MFAVGLPVLAGMVAASLFGIFLIPMLYVVFQTFREGHLVPHASEDAEVADLRDGGVEKNPSVAP